MPGPVDDPGLSTAGTWERYRLIADNSSDVVYQTTPDGRIQWIQPTVEGLLGYQPDELVGVEALTLVHQDDMATVRRTRTAVYDGAEIDEIPCRFRTRDGAYRMCTVRARPLREPVTGQTVGAIVTLRDASERLAALRALTTLSRAGAVLVHSHDENTLIEDTCRTVALSGQYPLAWYVRRTESGTRMVASSGTRNDFVLDVGAEFGSGPAHGAGARAIDSAAPVTIADLGVEPAYRQWREALAEHQLRSAVGLPVVVGDEVDGALVVFASETNTFDFAARELLEDLAAQLGYGIGRLRDAANRDDLLTLTEGERARLQATLDSLMDPVALLEVVRDRDGRAVDLRYVDANDAAIAYNRSTREAMIGATMLDLFPNLRDEGPLEAYLHCAETGEPAVFDDYAFSNRMLGEERRYDLRATQTPDGIALTWRDVTERYRTARRLADDERRYRLVAEHGSDVLWELDRDGRLVWSSASMVRILGWNRDELVGRQTLELVHPDDLESARGARARVMSESTAQGEYRMLCADGSYRWVEARTDRLDDDGHRIVAMRDVQGERAGRAELDHLAAHDPTTGAPVRAVALARLNGYLEQGAATTALLCADVDGLSRVNESVSYSAGDLVLATIADRIAGVVGDWDLVGRGSGDELLVLLPGLTEAAGADVMAEEIRDAVREPIEIDGHILRMTLSIGIATAAPGSEADAEQMLRDAGLAMSKAKEYGGDQAAYVDPEMSAQAARRLHLEGEIRDGLASGEFQAWLQPIASMESGEVTGYEALVRWVRADGSIAAPVEFLPLAERSGLIADIDAAVLDQSLEVLPRLPAGTTVAVNLAAPTLRRADLADEVLAALDRHGSDPARLHLEVTETALLEDVTTVRATMTRVADAGVHWYVDDFGTGYSSISHLRDLPIAGLKLDRSFTSGVAEGDRRCTELSLALVGLAVGLGLDGVAEGVETEEVAQTLAAHGWRHGQGWLYGRPAPPPTSPVPLA
ncbi:MAG TPA: EAL domain-containing protein [Candidatus Nanopelagicales bacterium]|nr:EAL domain-containing protein [Candidatus Nanopelagicales bacterium]